MATNAHSADSNPFREIPSIDQRNNVVGATAVPELATAQVTFSVRSPSIIPTPIYNDTSTIASFSPPVQSASPSVTPSISSVMSPHPTASNSIPSPSPLSRQLNAGEKGPCYEAKTQVETFGQQYGPTFRDSEGIQEQQYGLLQNAVTSPLLTKGFMPVDGSREMDMTEDIQLQETRRSYVLPEQQQPHIENFSAPQQSSAINSNHTAAAKYGRVNLFMNKLRSYRSPMGDEPTKLEEGRNASRGLGSPALQKPRGVVYRQLLGGGARFPLFTWVSGLVMIGVFIYEIVKNHELSGSWIMTNPFNPMIGPNYMALVTMGSKFVPCMREIQNYSPTTVFGNCYSSLEATCTVEQVCGFGGFHGSAPKQGFRFFTAIFLHAGVVHILMNLLTHFQTGGEVERTLGLIRYMILYIVSGVWGFVLSAVLAGPTVSSMGCSGALFGIIGYTVIDLIMQWKLHSNPRRELLKLVLVIIISLVLGLLPGLDNFAHIGGLLMGLLLGLVLAPINSHTTRGAKIIIWAGKILSLVLVIVLYAVLISKFYSTADLSTICPNCKYLSCLPINGWCDSVQ